MNGSIVRGALVALLLLNAMAMIAGSLLVVPYMPTDWILRGPFSDHRVPAIALGLAGVLCVGAAAFVVAIPPIGALLTIAAGLATTIFEIVEVGVVGLAVLEAPGLPQAWLQPFFFTYGLVVAALGFVLYRMYEPPRPAVMRRAASGGRL